MIEYRLNLRKFVKIWFRQKSIRLFIEVFMIIIDKVTTVSICGLAYIRPKIFNALILMPSIFYFNNWWSTEIISICQKVIRQIFLVALISNWMSIIDDSSSVLSIFLNKNNYLHSAQYSRRKNLDILICINYSLCHKAVKKCFESLGKKVFLNQQYLYIFEDQ